MKTKLFEVRDKGTCISAKATQLAVDNECERYLLSRAGYGLTPEDQSQYILLTHLDGGKCDTSHDQHHWGRTMHRAHEYIYQNWDTLKTGEVIDVEYILGETDTPKTSEYFTSIC